MKNHRLLGLTVTTLVAFGCSRGGAVDEAALVTQVHPQASATVSTQVAERATVELPDLYPKRDLPTTRCAGG